MGADGFKSCSITAMDQEGHAQTVSLGGSQNGSGTIQVRKHTAPSAFLAHGSVNVWDYHLTNYDDHGQVRVKPSTTTFSSDRKKMRSGIMRRKQN